MRYAVFWGSENMMTLHQIKRLLADRKLMLVSAATGIHRNTLAAIRDGENDNPSLATMTKLSEYFTGQMQ